MENGFNKYPISQEILETLALLNYNVPTKIQQEVIPLALEGRDIVAKSQTGTGKTAAFAIPVCEKVSWGENLPQALILEPTRELAVQVSKEIFYIGRKKRLKVPAVFGGFPIDKQIQTLRQKSHIIVGTPGRIMDHVRRETLKLQQIKYLVIDEADLMLDMGFIDEVKEIIDISPDKKQVLLFSATLESKVQELIQEYMTDAVSVILESQTETAEMVEQIAYETEQEDKYAVLLSVLIQENPGLCMIFCATREMVNVLYQKLKRNRIPCGRIHGELDQKERLKMIEDFRQERFRFLIATDVAARGIDFENITHVINYDFPAGRETYVHRIGRTGRNGKSGRAVSLVSRDERKQKENLEAYIGKTITFLPCPAREGMDEKPFWDRQKKKTVYKKSKGEALNGNITRLSVGGGRKSKIRSVDIVGTLCNIEQIDASDIGIIDIRDSLTYVEILNGKGQYVWEALQEKPIKGKIRKVRITGNLS